MKWACLYNQHPHGEIQCFLAPWCLPPDQHDRFLNSPKQNSTLQTLLCMSSFASCCTYPAISHILFVGGQNLSIPIPGSQLDWFHPMWGGGMLMFGPYNLPKRAKEEVASNYPTTQARMVRHKHNQCWDEDTRQWSFPSRYCFSTPLPVYFLEPNLYARGHCEI